MSYILKLAGWYPSAVDAFNGDFVQRHAKSIALFEKVIVVYVVKSSIHRKVTITKTSTNNLTEIIAYYPKHLLLDVVASNFYYITIAKKICKNIISEKGLPKLVHLNIAWKAGILALYLKRKYKLPYIITENWTGYYAADPNFLGNKKVKFALLKKVYNNATYLLPVTKSLENTCNALFKTELPYLVVENAVDVHLFHPITTTNTTITITHISTMGYQKNTDSLLKVLEKILTDTNLNCEVQLIGPYNNTIDTMIENSPVLKKHCNLTGNIPYEQVATYMQNASLLVLFSRYENLPCVILESLCCGVPVVATNVGGIAEVINNDNGILVPSEDSKALEDALTKMISSVSNYNKNQIADNAIQEYSYQAIGKKFSEAYATILKQTTSS